MFENNISGTRATDRKNHSRFLFLLLPAVLFLIIQAVLSGMAYVDQYRLNATLDLWHQNKTAPNPSEWIEIEKLALDALHGNESNADIVNAVGRLYDFQSIYMTSNAEEKQAFGQQAMKFYKQAIRLRPAWPYGWMNLASTKARLGEIDQEFKKALLQLQRLGPWEKNTLPAIVQLSMFAWPYLDSPSRQLLLDYLIVAQEKRKGEVRKALKESGQEERYCALLSHKGVKPSFCP